MNDFDVPVVLFLFKRIDKSVEIIRQISKVKPMRIYLLSDAGRNDSEQKLVEECRRLVESEITWECEIVRKYATENIGVFGNIAEGARWVFEQESFAIFLEDDNLPELTFFQFCKEMKDRYENEERILWVCGTNYLKSYEPENGASYVITKNMMPCGWASWSKKFLKYYDGELKLYQDVYLRERVRHEYRSEKLYIQDTYNLKYELEHKLLNGRFYSWDYQMSFSIRVHNLFAIVPKYNQIKNIGIDDDSTHGGSDSTDLMLKRFCNLDTKPMVFPLIHPKSLLIDLKFEDAVSDIIVDPRFFSLKAKASRLIRDKLNLGLTKSLLYSLKERFMR
ncbi:hypothetical protein [Rheinheimera soli]|uniref:hypothetical protein n=1 Tax=Rheinheimera soli TaxID=443616 RepID=UPI001E464312|nr:hypothetical protein [Rheinheimera soli]